MSTESAFPPTDPAARSRALERLIGFRSSKPSFYAAWRQNSAHLNRTIDTLERISSALCATAEGPRAVCDAVVRAAAYHLDAGWAAIAFPGEVPHEMPAVILHLAERNPAGPADHVLRRLAGQVRESRGPAMLTLGAEAVVVVPMPVRDELLGGLCVAPGPGVDIDASDLSILVTLANHAGVALHNAWLYQESERLRLRSEAVSHVAARRAAELERRNRQLEGARRRLEHAGRRQLISRERNRIARELHDSVAQHLLTIGLSLEWCRRQPELPLALGEHLQGAQALARAAIDEIRAAIFELARDGPAELPEALREVIEDVEAGTGLTVSFRVLGEQRTLPAADTHALVQIAREALFNVLRHAAASRAWLTLRWRAHEVALTVTDDGQGNPASLRRYLRHGAPCGEHLGLAGIGQRVAELDGTVALAGRPGGGVRLVVKVPLEHSGERSAAVLEGAAVSADDVSAAVR
jgi:signal transduction histidine kinase